MINPAALALRPFGEADFEPLCEWFADEQSLIQWGGPDISFPLDRAQLLAMLCEGEGERPRRWLFSGFDTTILTGHAQVALDWRNGVARLSRVAVSPNLRGRGLAEPFLRAVLDQILPRPEFERIELNVYTFNAVAIRVYRKLGFVEEGVRRSAVKVGSVRWDTAIYGLLRNDV